MSTPAPTLCQNCHVRPRYQDQATGKLHPFCGKSCANASTSSISPGSGNCSHCHARPKYSDATQTYPFCGKSCAKAAKLGAASGVQAPSNACSIPGCSRPAYRDVNGISSKYCSKVHKLAAETSCLACKKVQNSGASPFCRACRVSIKAKAPMLLEVPEEHVVYKSVSSQFEKTWRQNTPCPAVRAIYKIVTSQNSLDKYEAYRATVEARGQFLLTNKSAGNENRRWHGTKRQCNLGDKGCTTFCPSPACSLCNIIQTSFDMSLFGKGGCFGNGVYTSSTSSMSNGFSKNGPQSPWKAILLNKVVVGKGYKLSSPNSSLTGPPAGYDSVLAEVGTSLSNDELIVYTNDAVRPSYLLMYDGK